MTPSTRVTYDREFTSLEIGRAVSSALSEYRTRYSEGVDSVRVDEEDGTVQVTIRGSSNY